MPVLRSFGKGLHCTSYPHQPQIYSSKGIHWNDQHFSTNYWDMEPEKTLTIGHDDFSKIVMETLLG